MHGILTMDHGLGLLMRLNWDRLLSVVAIFLALTVGAWLGSL
ncbi:hypothetical protein PXK00_00765 [Phaeobacter sp. QD34_3]|nr:MULTISPECIES: hypothetical protein [unclassified Phaeobacter]MDE4131625.1 hypothetical protein [Phaeobacter sp. QD34_3]MDE4135286.1 hypothetical protein [Phaeobacter sp. QD34_24]MDE4174607.1 hypothetical protein [Phaeobacter sp. PT47_59]